MAPDMQTAVNASLAELERVNPQPAAVGYGVDLACEDDLTAGLSEVAFDSVQGIAQALRHRLTTDRDMTIIREDDPDYGRNVLAMLHKGVRQQDLTHYEQWISDECLKDDRVASLTVTSAVQLGPPVSMSFSLTVTPVNASLGVFQLVLSLGPDGAALELLA